jgi:hypothetical protein
LGESNNLCWNLQSFEQLKQTLWLQSDGSNIREYRTHLRLLQSLSVMKWAVLRSEAHRLEFRGATKHDGSKSPSEFETQVPSKPIESPINKEAARQLLIWMSYRIHASRRYHKIPGTTV